MLHMNCWDVFEKNTLFLFFTIFVFRKWFKSIKYKNGNNFITQCFLCTWNYSFTCTVDHALWIVTTSNFISLNFQDKLLMSLINKLDANWSMKFGIMRYRDLYSNMRLKYEFGKLILLNQIKKYSVHLYELQRIVIMLDFIQVPFIKIKLNLIG